MGGMNDRSRSDLVAAHMLPLTPASPVPGGEVETKGRLTWRPLAFKYVSSFLFFVVVLVTAPSSQALGPPKNQVRGSSEEFRLSLPGTDGNKINGPLMAILTGVPM